MRCARALNQGLHAVFEARDDVYLLGEDVLDPYGGAFKITAGLSDRFPDRVLTTPISEAALVGVANGMAMRGLRPIVEIMFGDFLTLAFDQIVNGASKFSAIAGGRVDVPLVIRTPMGGRRGYGATHSQSLEKHLIGVPHLRVVAASEFHDLGRMLAGAVDDDGPVLFVENKLMYGRTNRRPLEGAVDGFEVEEGEGCWPALTFRAAGAAPRATIAAYGGMAPLALEAATELIVEHELFTEVVVLGRLAPLDVDPVVASVERTGMLVTAEEGSPAAGVGSEIAAQVQAQAWRALRGPVVRVAALPEVIPAAPALEARTLPQSHDLVAAVLRLTGAHA